LFTYFQVGVFQTYVDVICDRHVSIGNSLEEKYNRMNGNL